MENIARLGFIPQIYNSNILLYYMMIIIKELNVKHLNDLALLHKEFVESHYVYDEYYYKLASDASKNFIDYVRDNVIDKDDKIIYVAYDDEKNILAGYVSGWVEQRAPIYENRIQGYLSNIFVCEEYRSQKVGKSLIDALFNWFKIKGIKHVELSVDSQNTVAQKAFEKCGFKEVIKRMRVELK